MSVPRIAAKVATTAVRRGLERLGLRNSYNETFYQTLRQGSIRSANRIAPIVAELVRPASVVDIGCGEGLWLDAFRRQGVQDILGVDGDYVDRSRLAIPPERFVAHDLNAPFSAGRTFDLAMSVETGEHIRPENAGTLVATLAALAPVVMFSAAVPFQGGRDHFNERWVDSWIRLFDERGFRAIDAIRAQIWDDTSVEWWYRQNIMLYVRKDADARYPDLLEAGRRFAFPAPVVVHPECYLQGVEWGWTRPKSFTTTYPGRA